jgi:hypothetical protein
LICHYFLHPPAFAAAIPLTEGDVVDVTLAVAPAVPLTVTVTGMPRFTDAAILASKPTICIAAAAVDCDDAAKRGSVFVFDATDRLELLMPLSDDWDWFCERI